MIVLLPLKLLAFAAVDLDKGTIDDLYACDVPENYETEAEWCISKNAFDREGVRSPTVLPAVPPYGGQA